MISFREWDDRRISLVREVDIPVVGVREFRRMRGEYYLTVDDVLGAKNFDDAGGLLPDVFVLAGPRIIDLNRLVGKER